MKNLTLSSDEIAALTGKLKSDIHRDIKVQLLEGLYGKIDDPNLDHEPIQGLTIVKDKRGYFKMLAMDINNNERYVLKITGKGLKALTPLVMRLIVIGEPA